MSASISFEGSKVIGIGRQTTDIVMMIWVVVLLTMTTGICSTDNDGKIVFEDQLIPDLNFLFHNEKLKLSISTHAYDENSKARFKSMLNLNVVIPRLLLNNDLSRHIIVMSDALNTCTHPPIAIEQRFITSYYSNV